ncbi:MAG: hypothetical protein LBN40_06565, partial [Oscillospiraceae bacterium]|nr:hypothetical protein [Oscillospiraceae bacterium]
MAETDIKKPAPIKAKAAATDTAVTTISKEKKKFFSFRHKPLVRVGKDIFYGNINDACVCMVKILKTESKNDVEVATATKVYLLPSENADPRSPEFLKTI